MADLLQLAQNIALNGGLRHSYGTRQPTQYADKQYEYFADPSHLHRAQMLPYASDYFIAEIQNWDRGGEWERVGIRMANVIKPTAAINRRLDEYKMVIPQDPTLNYLRPGTKIKCMGSTWLVVNPDNLSGGDGMAIVRQCKAVWNHLDYYGNVVSEPIIVDIDIFGHANASAPDSQTAQNVATGYYNVTCQYNDFTRQINDNTRLILGSKAYQVTGYGDFIQEFTSDESSVRLVSFAVRVLTSNDETDDMENKVAGGKTFSWGGYINGKEILSVGQTRAIYGVVTQRNGETPGADAEPFSYRFETDAEDVIAVEALGATQCFVTGLASGSAVLTAILNENPSVRISKTIEVAAPEERVIFTQTGPNAPMRPFQSVQLTAYYFNAAGSIRPEYPITYTATGAAEGSYGMTVRAGTVTVTCYGYSETPLTVTAHGGPDGTLTDSVTLRLEGI